MSAELLKDSTFFNGILNDPQLQKAEKGKAKNEKKSKGTSPKPAVRKTRASKSLQNENLAPEKTEVKKPRVSKKGERQPLGLVNTKVKSPKKDGAAPTAKKTAAPARKTRSLKPSPSPNQTKPVKERQSLPKITVYKDSPGRAKVQKKETKTRKSKSLEPLDTSTGKGRRSAPETKSKSQLTVPGTKKSQSFNDLRNIKSPVKKEKAVGRKSTEKTSSRHPKFKEGQPEFDEMVAKLESMFPNVDPVFLKSQFIKLKGSLAETIEFMLIKEKTNELPTRREYMRRLEAERLQNRFLENFSVENFLKMIPDPWEYFLKTEKQNSVNYLGHSLHYLKNKYKTHYLQAIHSALAKNGNSLYLANKELKKKNRLLKMRATNRSKYECDAGRPTTFDIQFVHEVAFIENESKIRAHIKKAETTRFKKFKEAEKAGTLLECESCNDFTLLQDDAVNCPANHVFCKDCVVKYVQIELEKENFQFKCLMKCEERFSMETLQAVLCPFVMAKIIRRNQLEEIKASGIDDLVYCPFCYYVTIMPPEISVLKCLNPSCMMETCRWCKQFNHIPLKCKELENVDKTILEVEIEIQEEKDRDDEKEEENVIVKCCLCDGEFLKREDSNQMICPCGATICSICRQPCPECPHFATVHRLSISSDDATENIFEDTTEDNVERSSDNELLPDIAQFLPSESDTF